MNVRDGDIIECCVEHRTQTSIFVTCLTPNGPFRGILVKDSLVSNLGKPSYGYYAEQLPSQFKKKLKNRLGIVFDSNCDSENSDSEPVKNNLKKLKFSEIKTLRDKLISAPPSQEIITCKAQSAQSRPNIPYKNNSQHDKKNIEGLTDFLKEAHKKGDKSGKQDKSQNESHISEISSSLTVSSDIQYNPKKKQKIISNGEGDKEKIHKNKKSTKTKSLEPMSPKSLKLHKTILELVTKNKQETEKQIFVSTTKSEQKVKSEKSKTKKHTPKSSPSMSTPPTSPSKKLIKSPTKPTFSATGKFRDYKMRSKQHPELSYQSSCSRSSTITVPDCGPDWPVWCPRRLSLCVPKCKKGRPARCKLKYSGCKRRLESDSDDDAVQLQDVKQTIKNNHIQENPFGIGDVVVAKRKIAAGRPFWPGKILSTSGMTVFVSFYQTCEKMQLPVSEIEWYFEACDIHKFYSPKNDGKVTQLWKDALADAEADSRVGVGVSSIVWALYDDEWWPARVIDQDKEKYTLMWLDNKAIQPVPFVQVNPFLQAYCVRYSKTISQNHDNYEFTVEKAYNEALMVALECSDEH